MENPVDPPGITLGPIRAKDRETILDMLTDSRISETYMLPDFDARADAVPLFQRLAELSRREDRFVRGMYEEGILVGFLNDVEISGDTLELGYAVHPDHWGRGYATAALKLAIGALFSMGFREIIAGAFEENAASTRVMERAGMQKIQKTDEIQYRSRVHKCVYCRISR